MKVRYSPESKLGRYTPPMLLLTPETEADQEALKLLVDNHDGYGFGRCPETGKVLHAEIYLRARVELSSLSAVITRDELD